MKIFIIAAIFISLISCTNIHSLANGGQRCLGYEPECLIDGGSLSYSGSVFTTIKNGYSYSWTVGPSGLGSINANSGWPYKSGQVEVDIKNRQLCFNSFGCCSSLPLKECRLPVNNILLVSDYAHTLSISQSNTFINLTISCGAQSCFSQWILGDLPFTGNAQYKLLSCNAKK